MPIFSFLKRKRPCDAQTVENLKSLFAQIPPSRSSIEDIFRIYTFTKEQLADLTNSLTEDCFREYYDALDPAVDGVTPEHMHSNYLLESLQQLLDHGLNPNIFFGEYDDNVMWNLPYVDAPNIGAAAMRLMLEHGADPNLICPSERESIFDPLDFSVSYDCYFHEYFFMVQCWLVLIAYGGRLRGNKPPLTMLNGNSVEIFKNFEYYDYEIEMLPNEPWCYGYWTMHIYDVRTKEEVARL